MEKTKVKKFDGVPSFSDLEFQQHPSLGTTPFGTIGHEAIHARIDFPNGYGASVVSGGDFFYTDDEHPYELAVMLDGKLNYDTPVTDDVVGHLSKDDVTQLLQKIAALSTKKEEKTDA